METPLFTEQNTLDDVERQLIRRFNHAATISVTPPSFNETNCHASVAWNDDQRDFPFGVHGRPADEVFIDVAKQIVRWMEANGKT